jgi:GT2 family glycosyltransferase
VTAYNGALLPANCARIIVNYESPVFKEASLSSANNADKRPVYEPIDYSDTDIASEEEVSSTS